MHLDKVEMGFAIDLAHALVVRVRAILVTDLAPRGRCHTFVYQRSLTSQLLSFLINLGLCAFRYWKLQEDIFHLVKSAQIILHTRHGLICMTTVLGHHIEVDKAPNALESTFARYHLCVLWLPQSLSKNPQKATPQIPHLFSCHCVTSWQTILGTKNPGYDGNVSQAVSKA